MTRLERGAGPKDCPETSVRNYHYSLRNNPQERSSELLRGGSLESRIVQIYSGYNKTHTGNVYNILPSEQIFVKIWVVRAIILLEGLNKLLPLLSTFITRCG